MTYASKLKSELHVEAFNKLAEGVHRVHIDKAGGLIISKYSKMTRKSGDEAKAAKRSAGYR